MPRSDYVHCRNCGRHASEAGQLSCTRLCVRCAKLLVHENVDGLKTMSNPARDRWRLGMLASVFPELLDDAKARR